MAPVTRLPHAFGRYVLREKVAAGGMAEVFRGSLPGFGGFEKTVAVKRMYRQYTHDQSFVEMLSDEAKIVSQLAHPNIVGILDIGRVHEDYYIALEFVDGIDLFRLLQKQYEVGRDLPVSMAIYVVAELCSALDYAHARRTPDGQPMHIVHRDVSPQNVLLSNQGEVKLTDFGIAKARYRYTQTQAGVVKGKLYYMSPEQARGAEIDHRSDLFSAGIILYELLCTRPLYDEEEQGRLLSVVGHAEYDWPREKRARLPAALTTIADRALHRSPSQRYQSGREFRAALLRAADQLGQRCDREEFGQYVRKLFDIPDDRPPPVRAAGVVDSTRNYSVAHWASQILDVPAVLQPDPPPTPSAAPTPILDEEEEAPGGPSLPRAKSAKVAKAPPRPSRPVPAPDRPRAPVSDLPPPIPLPDPSASKPEEPDEQEEPTSMLSLDEINRRLAADAPTDGASDAPTVGNAPPEKDDSTALIDLSQMGLDAGPPEEDDGTPTMQAKPSAVAPKRRPSRAVPRRPARAPSSAANQVAPVADAATRVHAAVLDSEPHAAALPPATVAHVATPISAIHVAGPIDPGAEPASWGLIGLTALVWAGVVVLGVYATLLLGS